MQQNLTLLKVFFSCIFTFFVLFICSNSLVGQTITVFDSDTDEPIGFVTVTQQSNDIYAITDINGIANISMFDSSKIVIFYIIGYTKREETWANLRSENYNISLIQQSFVIEPIEVSTSRWNQTTGKDPSKISRITSKDIALQNPQTAADMLGNSGEVFIQKSQQGGGSPMIRGFSANRLLYSVDGVRMNTAIFRSGNLQNVISIDPLSLDKSEIIFGPGSVAYGSDAIGGVMTFETKIPKLESNKYYGSGLLRYSSPNNEVTTHGDIAYGNQKLSALTSLTYNHYGDLRMGSKNGFESYLNTIYSQRIDNEDVAISNPNPLIQKNTGFDQYNLMQKIRYIPNKNWDVQLGLHYSTTSDYGRYDRLIRTENGMPRSAEWYYGPQEWAMANLQIFHNSTSRLFDKTMARLAYQKFGESRHDRDFSNNNLNTRVESVDALSLNFDFLKALSGKTQLSYGLEGVYNKVESTGKTTNISNNKVTDAVSRYPNSDWYSLAGFANYSHKINDKLLLDFGARLNYFDLESRFNTKLFPLPFETAGLDKNLGVSASLGLAYRPNDTWYFALNSSTGFRSPNVDDLGKIFDSVPGSVIVPNPNLTPENAYNIEGSITKTLFSKIRLDLTGYYTILLDGMVRRNFTFNGQDSIIYDGELSRVQSTINAAQIDVMGIQTGIEVQFPKQFKFYTRINIQRGDEELDDGTISPTRHASPTYGLIRLSKKLDNFYFEVNSYFSASYSFEEMPITEIEKDYLYAEDEKGNPFSPSWFTINAVSTYQLRSNININLKLENIFDRQYRPYSSGLVASGRGITISVGVSF